MDMSNNYLRGQLVSAAQALLLIYNMVTTNKGDDSTLLEALDRQEKELLRLLDNAIGFRNDWGDSIQLAGALILMGEGYIDTRLKR